MNPPSPPSSSFSAAQRLRVAGNVLLAAVAAGTIVVMVNYLAARHFHRVHWTTDARFNLSATTRSLLERLTNEVNVLVLFDRDHALFPSVYGLLTEYAYACPRLKLEHINYRRDPGRAELIAQRYQLASSEADLVIFDCEGRSRIVRATELSEYDFSPLLAGGREVRRTGFKGEALFTTALAAVQHTHQLVAGFLRGHGEHDPASEVKLTGYSRLAGLLRQKGLETRLVDLVGAEEVPPDCQLLIVAGPRSRLDPTELDKLNRYLQRGGRLLALLSFYQAQRARTGLEDLLHAWGIQVGDNYVLDPANSIRGNDLIISNFAAHPITSPLQIQDRRLHLILARSVAPRPGAGTAADPRPQPLFYSSTEGYTASAVTDAGVPKPDPGKDVRGAVPLAVAVERGGIQGLGADLAAARIVAVGESLFLGNELIVSAANLDFAGLAINWLLDRPQDLAGLAARPLHEYRIALTPGQMAQVRWLLLAVLPGSVLAFGGLVWWRRRA